MELSLYVNYINSEHLADWVSSGRASVAPVDACAAFHDELITFPWLPARLDWRTLRHVTLDAAEVGEKNIVAAFTKSGILLPSHLLALFAPDQPGLICAMEDGLKNLDHIYWKAPGVRYFCGVDLEAGFPRYDYGNFGEFDGFSKVTFRSFEKFED
jgi:hypothetical protein